MLPIAAGFVFILLSFSCQANNDTTSPCWESRRVSNPLQKFLFDGVVTGWDPSAGSLRSFEDINNWKMYGSCLKLSINLTDLIYNFTVSCRCGAKLGMPLVYKKLFEDDTSVPLKLSEKDFLLSEQWNRTSNSSTVMLKGCIDQGDGRYNLWELTAKHEPEPLVVSRQQFQWRDANQWKNCNFVNEFILMREAKEPNRVASTLAMSLFFVLIVCFVVYLMVDRWIHQRQ